MDSKKQNDAIALKKMIDDFEQGARFNDYDAQTPLNQYTSEIRIVLVGKTGTGKSATGNTILNREEFSTKVSGSSVTKLSSAAKTTRFGKVLVVVDTPGIFDTKVDGKDTLFEIFKCVGLTSPGPHAFLVTINVATRFTKEEEEAVENIANFFGDEFYQHAFVVFTNKGYLDYNNVTAENYLKDVPASLEMLLDKCSRRYVFFENRAEEREEQVKLLLKLISNKLTNGRNKHYTNTIYKEAEKILKQKEDALSKKHAEKYKQLTKQIKGCEKEISEKVVRLRSNREEHNELVSSINDLKEKAKFLYMDMRAIEDICPRQNLRETISKDDLFAKEMFNTIKGVIVAGIPIACASCAAVIFIMKLLKK